MLSFNLIIIQLKENKNSVKRKQKMHFSVFNYNLIFIPMEPLFPVERKLKMHFSVFKLEFFHLNIYYHTYIYKI